MDFLTGYEKVHSIIGSIVVTVGGLVMIGLAIHLLRAPKRKGSVEGTVDSYDPTNKTVNVSYKVGNDTYFLTSQGSMGKGSRVLVLYEETNPANARLSTQISNKTLALILLAIAIVVMALTYVSTYFVFKSKQYATIAGGLDLASQVTGMLRN
jgi:hypothetical protein